ncbi:MAG: hypothetical protein MUF33_02155 [Candidatus Nanopelagicales bacterium]|jgi:hypothetical protein|nr:hypothetical protein [Candidatus Nanopelagicales bacterium]
MCAGVRIDKRYDKNAQRFEYRARCLTMKNGKHHWQGMWWPVRFDRTDEEATMAALDEYRLHENLSAPVRGAHPNLIVIDEVTEWSSGP